MRFALTPPGCSDSLLCRAALTTEENAELQRRRTLLAYYVLFSPAYEVRCCAIRGSRSELTLALCCTPPQATLRPPLHALLRSAAPLPLVGTVLEKTVEVLESTLSFHAYTTSG